MLKQLAATVVAAAHTRLALLANEVQTQKHLALQQLALGVALMFCLGLGVLLAIALLVTLWWEARLWLLGAFTLLFLGASAFLYAALRRTTVRAAPPFEASLAELQEDLRQLKAASGQPPAP